MSYPSFLSYVGNSLSVRGVSVNSFRVDAQSTGAVSANQKISFNLPENAILDMQSTKLMFKASCTGDGARLPQNIATLFSSMQVTAGGVTIMSGSGNFGVIEKIKAIGHNMPPDPVKENGFMTTLYGKDGEAKGTSSAATAESYTSYDGALFSIKLGDLASMSPRLVDTSILPGLRVEFTVASNNVLSSVKGTQVEGSSSNHPFTTVNSNTAVTFTISDYFVCANVYSISDGIYPMLIENRIVQNQAVEINVIDHIPFEDNSFTGNMRASLSTANLSKLIAIFRLNGFSTIQAPTTIAGYKTDNSYALSSYGDAAAYTGSFNRFTAPVDNATNANLYTANNAAKNKYNDSPLPKLQFSINSANLPQWTPTVAEWYDLTKWAFNVKHLDVTGLVDYLNTSFVMAFPLDLPGSGTNTTGLDTRGSNSSIEIKAPSTAGLETTDAFNCLMVAQTVKTILVGAGKAIEVVS
jgi:hypothetical protein